MKLDKKKLFETCKTILSSADLDTITEKKVRRQVENELGLEDKILDTDPCKSIVKEILNKAIEDLQQKSESEADSSTSKAITKSSSTNKKSKKAEVKSKESSEAFEDEHSESSSKLNGKARNKESKQSSAESSSIPKSQASKAQTKISKTYGGSRTSSKSEKSKDSQDTNDNNTSPKPAANNVTSKTGQANEFKMAELSKETPSEEKLESALSPKRTTKSAKTNKEKQESRSRVKRKVNVSDDTDDNNKSSVKIDTPVSAAKGGNSKESTLPSSKRPKQTKIGTPSGEGKSKTRPKEKSTEKGQTRHKIDAVEDGGYIMALENELLAQNSDIVEPNPVLSGDDVESDNTIKDDDEGGPLKKMDEDDRSFRNNSEEGKQEPSGSKAGSTSPKRTIDSVEVKDEDSLSSLEDDKPQKKKRKTGKTKSVNIKSDITANIKSESNKSARNKSASNKTVENDDKRIKTLKSLVLKCGVRKNWTKEFANCDTDSDKIRRLEQILTDLGIEGRPTLEKCKKVKKRRELEAELGAMDIDNIISDDVKETRKARASRGIFNPVRRRVPRAAQSSPEHDDSPSEDIHSDFE